MRIGSEIYLASMCCVLKDSQSFNLGKVYVNEIGAGQEKRGKGWHIGEAFMKRQKFRWREGQRQPAQWCGSAKLEAWMIGKSSPPSCNTWGSGERQLTCLLWEKEFLRWLWVSGICDHHTFCLFVCLFPPYELWRSDPVGTFEFASSSQWNQPSQKMPFVQWSPICCRALPWIAVSTGECPL